MAQPAEFEEREFEAPLYEQLPVLNHQVWMPGQVFEQYVGFDRGVLLPERVFADVFGMPRSPRGVFLNRMTWDFVWAQRGQRPMPNFRLNLFLQAKRSHFHVCRPKHLSKWMSSHPCWHIDIEPRQQSVLANFTRRVGDRALVVYAGPVFHRVDELNHHTRNGTILGHCTFPRVPPLTGHEAWYYTDAGAHGIANPDPEPIASQGLLEWLREIRVDQLPNSQGRATEHLVELSRAIENSLRESPPDDGRTAVYFETIHRIDDALRRRGEEGPSVRAYLSATVFTFAFDLLWCVVG